jgi:hypothetical protein
MGGDRVWSKPCVIILDAEAAVKSPGPDSIVSGGIKTYAPRYSTGRLEADACCLLKDQNGLLILQQLRHKDGTGQEHVKQTLVVVDVGAVTGVEYNHVNALKALGVQPPLIPEEHEYRPGMLVG